MDVYSLIGACKVRAEQLALHRTLGTACFYQADLKAAEIEYKLALQYASKSVEIRKLLEACQALDEGNPRETESILTNEQFSFSAQERNLRGEAFRSEKETGENYLRNGFGV